MLIQIITYNYPHLLKIHCYFILLLKLLLFRCFGTPKENTEVLLLLLIFIFKQNTCRSSEMAQPSNGLNMLAGQPEFEVPEHMVGES